MDELKKFLESLGPNIQLSDENIEQLTKLFELAVDAKSASTLKEKEEELQESLLKEATETKEMLIEKLTQYCEEAIKEYVIDFNDPIMNATKVKVYEKLIETLKNAFKDNSITLEEGSSTIISDLEKKVDDLETSLDEKVNENIELKDDLLAERAKAIFVEETQGMTELDIEKLKKMLNETEFDNVESAKEKIILMRDNFISKNSNYEDKKKNDQNSDKDKMSRSERAASYL